MQGFPASAEHRKTPRANGPQSPRSSARDHRKRALFFERHFAFTRLPRVRGRNPPTGGPACVGRCRRRADFPLVGADVRGRWGVRRKRTTGSGTPQPRRWRDSRSGSQIRRHDPTQAAHFVETRRCFAETPPGALVSPIWLQRALAVRSPSRRRELASLGKRSCSCPRESRQRR